MRKAHRKHPLTEAQTKRNRYLSKPRYVVEQSFGTLHRKFRYAWADYFGLSKVSAQSHLKAMCLNLLKAANRLSAPVEAVGCLIIRYSRGDLSRTSGYLKQKQPKIFVWISAVGEKDFFAKVSGRLKAFSDGLFIGVTVRVKTTHPILLKSV